MRWQLSSIMTSGPNVGLRDHLRRLRGAENGHRAGDAPPARVAEVRIHDTTATSGLG
jgi:hypothetical protein